MTGKHRLFIEKITSVGAVEEADNPESSIVFWKSKPEPKPEPTKLAKAAQRRVNRDAITHFRETEGSKLEAIEKGLEELRQIPLPHVPNQREATMPTTEDLTKTRDEWVEKHKRDGETIEAARARFWREHPTEVEKSRQSGPAPAADVETVGDAIAKRLESWARRRHLQPRYGDLTKTRAELKTEFWSTAEGQTVKQWLRAGNAEKPADTIEKDAEISKALALLDQ